MAKYCYLFLYIWLSRQKNSYTHTTNYVVGLRDNIKNEHKVNHRLKYIPKYIILYCSRIKIRKDKNRKLNVKIIEKGSVGDKVM